MILAMTPRTAPKPKFEVVPSRSGFFVEVSEGMIIEYIVSNYLPLLEFNFEIKLTVGI
ncbi:hypothetical protein D3C78_1133790 [compost metagenome]